MSIGRPALVLLVAACGASTSPANDPPVPRGAPLANTAPAPSPIVHDIAPPTVVTAGAADCRLGPDPAVLGEQPAGDVRLGFDTGGGLAAWKSGPMELSLRPIHADGTPFGAAMTVTIDPDAEATSVIATPAQFRVLVKLWNWQSKRLAWFEVIVDRAGPLAHAPVEVTADDAARIAAPTATADAITFEVVNAATPPPRGAGGVIYEAMAQPTLHRARAGAPVGRPPRLEWHGNSVAHGMHADPYIEWSGTHFLYPFTHAQGDGYVVRVLAIDCR